MIDTKSNTKSVSGNPVTATATAAIDKPAIDTSDICRDIHLLLDRIIHSMRWEVL